MATILLPALLVSTIASHTDGRQRALRLGDVLDRSLFSRNGGGAAPLLLLARGQQIETVAQLEQLRQAGYRVEFPEGSRPSRGGTAESQRGKRGGDAEEQFQHRTFVANRVREAIILATRSLMRRVSAGDSPAVAELLPACSSLTEQVAADPYALAALTYLTDCDDYTIGHSVDVSILMVAIARMLDYPAEELTTIALAGMLHDVGKQRLPPVILEKQGPLTPDEYAEVQQHPIYGHEILSRTPGATGRPALVALQHHERLDGTGYPNGLSGAEMDNYSLLACVADTFDAMTTDRVYQPAVSAWRALAELHIKCRDQFDRTTVLALTKLVGVFPVGTRVRLDSGEVAVVVAPNPENTAAPVVKVERDKRGHALPWPFLLNLADHPRRIVVALD